MLAIVGFLLIAVIMAYFFHGPKSALRILAASTTGFVAFFVLVWTVRVTGYGYGVGLALGEFGIVGMFLACVVAA